jgi:hypothetical protein
MTTKNAIESIRHAVLLLGSLKIEACESGRLVQVFNVLNFALQELEKKKEVTENEPTTES